MGISIILDIAGWVAVLLLAEVTLSCAYRIATIRMRWLHPSGPLPVPDHGWLLPMLTSGSALIIATILGAVPWLGALIGSALTLGGVLIGITASMITAIGQGTGLQEARRTITVLWRMARMAGFFLAGDLRALLRRGGEPGAPAAGRGAASPAAAARRRRAVPSYREDAALGSVPSASQVSASLQASGATVPPAWAALADWIAGFEPDDDEDELLEFVAGNAAGVLHVAEAFQAVAETLMTGAGLDPAYAEGFIEMGDETADLAAALAMIDRRYHAVYGEIREFADSGGVLPHNARRWFHAHGQAQEGGRAA